nr:PIN domain-containing protein [Phytoactinopolyspora halotolerans]
MLDTSVVVSAPDADERMRRIVRLNDVQRGFTVLRVEEDVAASYGLLAAASKALNRTPRRRAMDLLIAASAHAYDATLFTRNPDDFQTYGDLVHIHALPPRPTPAQS